MNRPLVLVATAIFLVLAAPEATCAQPASPPEVVRLRDGSFARGTIVESTPDHVVLQLATGEIRTYSRSEVLSAGSEAPPARERSTTEPSTSHEPSASITRLRATADGEELSLQRLTGSTSVSVWTGRGVATAAIDQFAVICNLPCDIELPAGAYQLGVARGTGTAVRTGPPVTLDAGDLHLAVHYENREGARIAGWVTFIGAMVAGAAILATSFAVGDTRCGYDSAWGSYRCSHTAINVPMLVAGSVIFGLGLAIGLPLAMWGDGASVEITPEPSYGGRHGEATPSRPDASGTRYATWPDRIVRDAIGGVEGDVIACLDPDRPGVRLAVELLPSGRAGEVQVLDEVLDHELLCVRRAFAAVRLDGVADASRTITMRFERPAAPTATRDVESELRASLDANARAILACLGVPVASLTVSWSEAGAIVVLVRGHDAGSPEGACVTTATTDLTLDPAPGVAGALTHALAAPE